MNGVLKPKATGNAIRVPREDLEAARKVAQMLLEVMDRWLA